MALPNVTIRGERPQRLSTYHGEYIKGVRPLTPGQRCVVWLPSPDTTAAYQVESLTVPLHQRYTAGRLRITFYERGRGTELLGAALPVPGLVVAPPDSVAKRRTQLRLDLRHSAFRLPMAGVLVVVDCLPTQDDEVYVRRVAVARRKTRKDGSTVVKPYILTRRGTDTTTVWTLADAFPKLRQSPAGYVANTWMRWDPRLPYRRENAQTFRGRSVQAFDTVLLLQVSKI